MMRETETYEKHKKEFSEFLQNLSKFSTPNEEQLSNFLTSDEEQHLSKKGKKKRKK